MNGNRKSGLRHSTRPPQIDTISIKSSQLI
jgi:hypothetical protein